jgi:hypothetical protein
LNHEGHEEHEGYNTLLDITFYTVLKSFYIKVDQKAFLNVQQLHVSQQLRLMDRQQLFDTFEFKDDRIFNKKIQSVSANQINPFIDDWQGVFGSNEIVLISNSCTKHR